MNLWVREPSSVSWPLFLLVAMVMIICTERVSALEEWRLPSGDSLHPCSLEKWVDVASANGRSSSIVSEVLVRQQRCLMERLWRGYDKVEFP
jgi:hypothetical protein